MVTYSFASAWVTPAPIDDVTAIAADLERYPEWWPQIRAVAKLGPDHARVLLRSALPFTLDVVLEAVSREPPELEVAVSGAVEGTVVWRFSEVADGTRCDYRQQVAVRGALVPASYAVRPLLVWNHHRAMIGCQRGLRSRLCG